MDMLPWRTNRTRSVEPNYQQSWDVEEDFATSDYVSTADTSIHSSDTLHSTSHPDHTMSTWLDDQARENYEPDPLPRRRLRPQPVQPNSHFSQQRWPWDQDYLFDTPYQNPLLPVRYSPYNPFGQEASNSLNPYQYGLYGPPPPPPTLSPPTLPPIPTTTLAVPPDKMPIEKATEMDTNTAKSLVPASVHSASISNETTTPAITDEQTKPKSRRAVDAVHDPSVSTKDICVQLEIPIEDDPRSDLETFSRFKRLGRFNDAREFFDTQLDHFRTTPYVFVQYAEMLLAAGDLRGFRQLVYPDDFFHRGPALPNNELAASFELMKFLAQPVFVDYPVAIMKVVQTVLTFLKTESIWGSTEVCSCKTAFPVYLLKGISDPIIHSLSSSDQPYPELFWPGYLPGQ